MSAEPVLMPVDHKQAVSELHKSLRQKLKSTGRTHLRFHLDNAGRAGDLTMLTVYDRFLFNGRKFSGNDINVLNATCESARILGVDPTSLDEAQFKAQHEARRILVRTEGWTVGGYEAVRLMLLKNQDYVEEIIAILSQRGPESAYELNEMLHEMKALPRAVEDGLL